jgi:hypothetical protein
MGLHAQPTGMQTVMVGGSHAWSGAQSSSFSQPLGSGVEHDGVSTHRPPPQSRVQAQPPFTQSQRDGMHTPLAS